MNMLYSLPGMSPEEMAFIESITKELNEEQQKQFIMIYSSRRKDPQMILLLALLGFVGVAGVHRMIVGEIGMGLVYFFTGGFCLIGTIVDLINYKNIAGEFNRRQAMESVGMVKQYVK
jgi:TM2 domain-containing membrane protein YozV